MTRIITFFKKLPLLGIVTDDLDRLDIQKIRVTNGLFFMVSPILAYYSIYNIVTYDGKTSILYILSIILGSGVVFLNYKEKYEAAKIYSIVFNIILCLILHLLFGSRLVLEPMIIVYVVFSAYLINNRKTALFLVIIISTVFLLLKHSEEFYAPPLAERVLYFSPVVFFVLSVMIISFFIFERRNEIELHLQEKNIYENRLQNINGELKKQKHLIENQNVELEVKNNELNQFAYIAAHDLKTPVRSVLSFSQLAKMNLDKENYAKVDEFLGIITTSTTHLNELIKDLLSYSLLEKDSIDTELIDLNELFDSALLLINDRLKKPIDIKATGLTKANVNPLQFKLLFQNLIENGIKYNRSEFPKVLIDASIKDGNHIITFRDNGIGIDDSYKSQIFEIFKRLHTTEEFEGSGLGLAICKKIIDRHDGSIDVTDSSSAGTEFTIKWPVNLS